MSRRVPDFSRIWHFERRLRTVPIEPGRHVRVPGEPPLRFLVWLVVAQVVVVVLWALPVIGDALGAMTLVGRHVLLPGVGAYLATHIRIDGRPVHVYVRHRLGARR